MQEIKQHYLPYW